MCNCQIWGNLGSFLVCYLNFMDLTSYMWVTYVGNQHISVKMLILPLDTSCSPYYIKYSNIYTVMQHWFLFDLQILWLFFAYFPFRAHYYNNNDNNNNISGLGDNIGLSYITFYVFIQKDNIAKKKCTLNHWLFLKRARNEDSCLHS